MNPSTLVVVSGRPGVGKSELAAALMTRIPAEHISRDQVVESMGGPAARLDRTFSRILGFRRRSFQDRATRHLECLAYEALCDHDVVVEVVADPPLRSRLRQLAAKRGATYLSIEVVCSDTSELKRRLGTRGRRWIRIAQRTARYYEPDHHATLVDSVEPVSNLVDTVVGALERSRRSGPPDAP